MIKPLIWVNAIVFVLTLLGGTSTRDSYLLTLIKLHPNYIRDFQLWRLGTYMFAHGSFTHVLFNMWGLFIFGSPLERKLGPTRFMYLYFTSGVVGGLVWLAANWNAPTGGVIGASGAVFGVMMAAAMTFPNERIMLLFPPIPMKLKTFVAGYAAIEIYMALNASGGQIAHIAHLGGILGGFLFMRRLRHPNSGRNGFLKQFSQWWRQFLAAQQRKGFKIHNNDNNSDQEKEDAEHLSKETDRILDKIGRKGLQSLTAEERETLEKARKRLRDLFDHN